MNKATISFEEALFEYCLRLGDTSLIMGQRLSEWCGHAPYLEEDIAISNFALDYIGQARIILSYAGKVEDKGRNEDSLAYLRDALQFRNLLMAEQPNGDFGTTVMKQYLIGVYNFHLYSLLQKSKDSEIAAFAAKSLKEVAYHVRHSGDWVSRLGDGTDESKKRIQDAIEDLWYFVDDMFQIDDVETMLLSNGVAADLNEVKKLWTATVTDKFKTVSLTIPEVNNAMRLDSRKGNHTEHLGYILAEMQVLPRSYPDAKW